ncbi:hypothetical protein KUV73_09575 [Mameliella alba]|nr:hypothetical protein [Mameliella alba]MBY6169593.1 hypothetical protein [Mameliella alba]MBY6174612.1 hypothetical protein [Mameliella alba]
MPPIRKIQILHQTHTDLGYTDHADVLRLHHRDILAKALDLCEETADAPPGAQVKWSCEVTGTTLDFLRNTSSRNVDRFRALHEQGRIAVGALRWHWTPLVSPALAAQTLKDIDSLRDDFGIRIRSAMQCDVNGLAWFWNDLLTARGVDFLLTQQNPHRGYWGDRVPSAWWWKNRSGGRMLVAQAEHYGIGGGYLMLARRGQQMLADLQEVLDRHSASPAWPFDFTTLTVTNTANGDNVFPDQGLSGAVADWNAKNEIQMEIVTLDDLAQRLHAKAEALPEQSGEWMDSWSDGEASTPLETAAARSAERLLPVIEALGGDARPEFEALVEALALYDEHTWGAHSSATAPESLFTTMQRTVKSNHAYRAFALAQRLTATASRARLASPVEGDAGFGATSGDALPDAQSYLVANPTDLPMSVDWPVPFDRGAGPQISIPQGHGTNAYFPGFGEDGWTDKLQPGAPDGQHRLRAELPPRAAIVIRPTLAETGGTTVSATRIDTPHARLELDAASGALTGWLDKASGTQLIDGPTLAPSVDLLHRGFTRRQIFRAPYWERSGLPMGWEEQDLWEEDSITVTPGKGFVDASGGHLPVTFDFACGIHIAATWTLPHGALWPRLVAQQSATGVSRAFSINWPVDFAGFTQGSRIDTGGGMVDTLTGHITSSCLRWQSAQRGVALDAVDGRAIALATPDTPLFQPGGPATRSPHKAPARPDGGVFWAINTHWDTNFPSHVHDPAPFRLTLGLCSHDTTLDTLEAMTATPVIVRAPCASEGPVPDFWPTRP